MRAAIRQSPIAALLAALAAAALVALTLDHFRLSADGFAWSVVQVVLVVIAWFDILERRILNAVTAPTAIFAVFARVVFERASLAEILVAGIAAFAAFLAAALALRGGLGMGDVKLAGVIGLLLGRTAASALLAGVVGGGFLAMAILIRSGSRKSTFAYGPCLAAGAAAVILLGGPPPLL